MTDWSAALCAQMAPEDWFPENRPLDRVRETCQRCEIRQDCLDFALRIEAVEGRMPGTYGGLNAQERQQILRARKSA